VLSNPLKQGNVSRIHATRPRRYIYRAQGTPPMATSVHLQGSRRSSDDHVIICTGLRAHPCRPRSSKLHPHCTTGHLLVSIKGGVQGSTGGGEGRGREREKNVQRTNTRTHDADEQRQPEKERRGTGSLRRPASRPNSLSLSLSRNACNPYCKRPLVQDNISLIPSLVFHLASTHLYRGTRH
jgi:hypothetical protein